MSPVAFLVGLLLTYLALAGVAVTVVLAARQRSAAAGGALIGAIALGALVQRFTPAPFAAPIAWSAVVCVGATVVYVALLRPALTWHDRRAARETGRQVGLHLLLLTGSAIFMVPFAWLVVTSLKEDEDMSRFPPVWIPRQQVKTWYEGREAGLAKVPYRGRRVTVAVLQEKETGENVVAVLSPAELRGTTLQVPRASVEKVRQFAPVWKNYPDALEFLPPETHAGLVFLWNTVFLCALSIVGTLLSSSLVAFSFARLRWPGRNAAFVVLLATMMLPGAVTMMPVFLIFRWLGWIDTLRPLWVPTFLGSAFNVFLLRQFFLTIPNDLEDAAKIDGCSYFGIYWRIMLPLIKPALAAITIMTFMASWNNFMGPLIYVSSPERMPVAYALQLFQTAHGGEPGLLMAASTMMMLPVLVIFFLTQRYFIQGVTLTGIKG